MTFPVSSRAYRESSGHFVEYILSQKDVAAVWHQYTHHQFVQGLASGELPLDKFKNYLIQDYLFLVSRPKSHPHDSMDL